MKNKEERTVAQYYPYIFGYPSGIKYELLWASPSDDTAP